MIKQTKISSLQLVIGNYFLIFQNYLATQLAMIVTFFKYSMQARMFTIFSAKSRDNHSSRQEALYLSQQISVSEMILPIVGSKELSISIYLFSVIFFISDRVLWGFESMKGWTPLQMKQSKQPADHTSHLQEYFSFLSCSGDAQMGVPLSSEKLSIFDISVWFTLLAQPKSATLMIMPFPMSIFSGLRSRCKTPSTLITMKACTICLNILKISWTVSCLFFFLQQFNRSPSPQYSITMSSCSFSSSKLESYILMRFGWTNFFMTQISFRAWSPSKGLTWMRLRAKDLSLLSLARYTLPKLPYPMVSIILQCCMIEFQVFLYIIITSACLSRLKNRRLLRSPHQFQLQTPQRLTLYLIHRSILAQISS